MLFANTKSDIGNRYRKTSIGKYRDRIGSNMKISESDRELKNEIGTSLIHIFHSSRDIQGSSPKIPRSLVRFWCLKTQKSETTLQSGKLEYTPLQRFRLHCKDANLCSDLLTSRRRIRHMQRQYREINKHVGLFACVEPSSCFGSSNKRTGLFPRNVQIVLLNREGNNVI